MALYREQDSSLSLLVEPLAAELNLPIDDVAKIAIRMHSIASKLTGRSALLFKDMVRRHWIATWRFSEPNGYPIFFPNETWNEHYKNLKIKLLKELGFPVAKKQFQFPVDQMGAIIQKSMELVEQGPVILKVIFPFTSIYAPNYWIRNSDEVYTVLATVNSEQNLSEPGCQIWMCPGDMAALEGKAIGRYVEESGGQGYLELVWGGGGREIDKLGQQTTTGFASMGARIRVGSLDLVIDLQNPGLLFQYEDGNELQRKLASTIWQHLRSYRSHLLRLVARSASFARNQAGRGVEP